MSTAAKAYTGPGTMQACLRTSSVSDGFLGHKRVNTWEGLYLSLQALLASMQALGLQDQNDITD